MSLSLRGRCFNSGLSGARVDDKLGGLIAPTGYHGQASGLSFGVILVLFIFILAASICFDSAAVKYHEQFIGPRYLCKCVAPSRGVHVADEIQRRGGNYRGAGVRLRRNNRRGRSYVRPSGDEHAADKLLRVRSRPPPRAIGNEAVAKRLKDRN